jgi:phenylpropionate dioxygenase-like ring-hydroxylating dioxygenase large terminal subunit
MVAYDDDLAPGEVTAIRYWGTDLVLWRDGAGDYHLQDAYCPHLGAHLGVGGTVEGATLQCPFHGWTFDGAGACTNIPYSQRDNRKAKLRTYPVAQRNRMVYAWRHPDGLEPQWDVPAIPEIGDAAWSEMYRSSYVINTVPQEMAENGVDPAHFRYVHGTDSRTCSHSAAGPANRSLRGSSV